MIRIKTVTETKNITVFTCDFCDKELPKCHLDVPRLSVGVSMENDQGNVHAPTKIYDRHRHFCNYACFLGYVMKNITLEYLLFCQETFEDNPKIPF